MNPSYFSQKGFSIIRPPFHYTRVRCSFRRRRTFEVDSNNKYKKKTLPRTANNLKSFVLTTM